VAAVVTLATGAGMMIGLGGCQQQQQQQQQQSTKVPSGATTVGMAQAQPWTWYADRTGTLYVVDKPDDKVIYRGPVRTGQTVVVDPQVKRITVEGREVSQGKLVSGHRNDIYLQSGAVRTDRPDPANRVGETK
jgi:hypothetical protein